MGDRDPAAPLLTLRQGPDRVELSGATTANWVAKTANLLVDGYGAPETVGVLLPLHWQAVVILLAGVASGAGVTVAGSSDGLAGCLAVFTTRDRAEGVLPADEVFVVSCHPLGLPVGGLGPGLTDFATEVPGYGDHWAGGQPGSVLLAGRRVEAHPVSLTESDRVLTVLDPADHVGLSLGLLAPLAAGAHLILARGVTADRMAALAADERVTATVGIDLAGLPRLDGRPTDR
ncbi:MAG: TIGR03089 family protein [Actinomycetota bacterium]|nr:TIGR03089 family protein [Actinomycetota bacterium]